MLRTTFLVAACTALGTAACGGGDEGGSLAVAWTFSSGDCESLGVETVRVTWTPEGGESQVADFACADGGGELGDPGSARSFQIDAEGLDANGNAVAESYGVSVMFGGDIPPGHTVDFALHPARADVVVSWSLASGGTCPSGVVLPYFITLYEAPETSGGELGDSVADTQESCTTGEATLTGIAPGSYVVEVDSRAVTPALRATAPVTVVAGEDAEVSVRF